MRALLTVFALVLFTSCSVEPIAEEKTQQQLGTLNLSLQRELILQTTQTSKAPEFELSIEDTGFQIWFINIADESEVYQFDIEEGNSSFEIPLFNFYQIFVTSYSDYELPQISSTIYLSAEDQFDFSKAGTDLELVLSNSYAVVQLVKNGNQAVALPTLDGEPLDDFDTVYSIYTLGGVKAQEFRAIDVLGNVKTDIRTYQKNQFYRYSIDQPQAGVGLTMDIDYFPIVNDLDL